MNEIEMECEGGGFRLFLGGVSESARNKQQQTITVFVWKPDKDKKRNPTCWKALV